MPLETVCLRYFNIFGPRQDPSSAYSGILAKFSMQMLRGEQPTIFGDGETSRDFTYIDNAVSANLLACSAPAAECAGRVFNCATGRRSTLNETFEALKKLTDYKGAAKYGPEREGDIKHSLADITQAQKHLGYKVLVNFEDGLRRTVEWYKSQKSGRRSLSAYPSQRRTRCLSRRMRFRPVCDFPRAISSFRSYRNGPYALKVCSLNRRLAPQLRQTWYEYPCMPIGQLILPCQHPRNATTAAPARLLATIPGHHQFDFLSFSSFCCSPAWFITSPDFS